MIIKVWIAGCLRQAVIRPVPTCYCYSKYRPFRICWFSKLKTAGWTILNAKCIQCRGFTELSNNFLVPEVKTPPGQNSRIDQFHEPGMKIFKWCGVASLSFPTHEESAQRRLVIPTQEESAQRWLVILHSRFITIIFSLCQMSIGPRPSNHY